MSLVRRSRTETSGHAWIFLTPSPTSLNASRDSSRTLLTRSRTRAVSCRVSEISDVAVQVRDAALQLEEPAVQLLRQPLELGVVGIARAPPPLARLEGRKLVRTTSRWARNKCKKVVRRRVRAVREKKNGRLP